MSPVGQQWTDAGAGALSAAYLGMAGCSRLGYSISPLGGSCLTLTELPELTQDWETDSWMEQTEPCVHQDPEERSSDPTRD